MENMTEKEISLQQENDSLKSELELIKVLVEMRAMQSAEISKENSELKMRIKFLEGQIETYKNIMDCRS